MGNHLITEGTESNPIPVYQTKKKIVNNKKTHFDPLNNRS